MCADILCVAAALLGVGAGWQPAPEGGVVYLIQIEPHVLDRLASGEITAVGSDVPPFVKDIRSYQISVGTAELPRELPPATELPATELPATELPVTEPQPPAQVDLPSAFEPGQVQSMWPPKAESPAVPQLLDPDPVGRKMELQPASYAAEATESSPSPSDVKPQPYEPDEPAKPWLPLTVALLVLFASLGGNLFMGWITWDARCRYRALLSED